MAEQAENAFGIARRKAIKGHRDQVVWQDARGDLHTALYTADAVKLAMLATGTQRHFWRIAADTGQGMTIRWRMAVRMLRNCRRGFDGPRMAA